MSWNYNVFLLQFLVFEIYGTRPRRTLKVGLMSTRSQTVYREYRQVEHTVALHLRLPSNDQANMTDPLHILTLNCWGLKYLAAYRHDRLKQIGAEIAAASPQPSIVALQECWTQQDYNSIRQQTKHYSSSSSRGTNWQ